MDTQDFDETCAAIAHGRYAVPAKRRSVRRGTNELMGLTAPLACAIELRNNARPRGYAGGGVVYATPTTTMRQDIMTTESTPASPIAEAAQRLEKLHAQLPESRNALTDAVDETIEIMRAQAKPAEAYDALLDLLPLEARREVARTVFARVTVRDGYWRNR